MGVRAATCLHCGGRSALYVLYINDIEITIPANLINGSVETYIFGLFFIYIFT